MLEKNKDQTMISEKRSAHDLMEMESVGVVITFSAKMRGTK